MHVFFLDPIGQWRAMDKDKLKEEKKFVFVKKIWRKKKYQQLIR